MLSGLGARMTAQQAEELTELQFLEMDSAEKSKKMAEGLTRVFGVIDRLAESEAVVHKALHANARLHIGTYIAVVAADVAGPVRITLDDAGEPVIEDLAAGSKRPLASVAELSADPDAVDLKAVRSDAKLTGPGGGERAA